MKIRRSTRPAQYWLSLRRYWVSSDTLLGLANAREKIVERDTMLAKKFLEAETRPASDRKTVIQVIDSLIDGETEASRYERLIVSEELR